MAHKENFPSIHQIAVIGIPSGWEIITAIFSFHQLTLEYYLAEIAYGKVDQTWVNCAGDFTVIE